MTFYYLLRRVLHAPVFHHRAVAFLYWIAFCRTLSCMPLFCVYHIRTFRGRGAFCRVRAHANGVATFTALPIRGLFPTWCRLQFLHLHRWLHACTLRHTGLGGSWRSFSSCRTWRARAAFTPPDCKTLRPSCAACPATTAGGDSPHTFAVSRFLFIWYYYLWRALTGRRGGAGIAARWHPATICVRTATPVLAWVLISSFPRFGLVGSGTVC